MDQNNLYSLKSGNFKAIEIPVMKESRGKDWIAYGKSNLYPQELIELYDSSAMHHTCVEAIRDGIYGEGILTYGDEYVNQKGETLNDIFEKIALDYTLFQGYVLNVIWNKEGTGIAEMYHLPFSDVRSGKMDDEGTVNEYFYSIDWTNTKKNPPVPYKAFDTTDNKKDNSSQIFYVFGYNPGNYVYPVPAYIGGLNDISLDCEVSKFHTNNISNSLQPSMFIKFRGGVPNPEERNDIYREIERTFTGPDNAGKFFLSFSDAENAMEVQEISSGGDTYYITLEERISSRILTAHRITSPLLLGVKDSSGFSSNADEIIVAYGHFEGIVIEPKRKKIIDSLSFVMKLMGYNVKLQVIPSTIVKQQTQTILDGNNSAPSIGTTI